MMGMTETKDLSLKLEFLCRDGSDSMLIRDAIAVLISHILKALIELEK